MILERAWDYPRIVATAAMGLFLTTIVILAFGLLTGSRFGCRVNDDDVLIQRTLEHFVVLQNSGYDDFLRYNLFSSGPVLAPWDGRYLVPISVDYFRAKNVDCCEFSYRGEDGWLPKWLKRFSTDYEGVVTINYKLRRVEGSGTVETVHKAEIPINSCAEPIPLSRLRNGIFD